MARAETATVADRYRVWVGTTVLRITVRFGRLRARGGAVRSPFCQDELRQLVWPIDRLG